MSTPDYIVLESIQLPVDLEWIDEHEWLPVRQQAEHATSGALLLEESAVLAGRPITLRTGSGNRQWWAPVPRSTVLALRALAAAPRAQDDPMTLVLSDGGEWLVHWRHTELAVEARPLRHVVPPEPEDLYAITLRLIAHNLESL